MTSYNKAPGPAIDVRKTSCMI